MKGGAEKCASYFYKNVPSLKFDSVLNIPLVLNMSGF